MSVMRSHKASLDADFKNNISTLIKDEIITAMNNEEMKSAISNQVKQLIKSELNSIVKPLEDDLASIKVENSRLCVELLNIKKQNTTLSLHSNEQYSRKYNVRIEEVHAEDCFAAVSNFFETEKMSLLMTLILIASIELEDKVFLLIKLLLNSQVIMPRKGSLRITAS
ncbi:Hypothetical predicted protein [Paramuricea clavata]|uniref:Uncharacterized protein n=1 Tax=Paramuricea clavata TaxID=317549 RepID=A0A7D9LNJ5_PARCT|nr:Hypothetical predicted protein [Paramuricea clavata]